MRKDWMSTGISRSTMGGLYGVRFEIVRASLFWITSIIREGAASQLVACVVINEKSCRVLKDLPSKAICLSSQHPDFLIAIFLWQGGSCTSIEQGVAASIIEILWTWSPQKCIFTTKLLDETSTNRASKEEVMDLRIFIEWTNVIKLFLTHC